MARIAKNREARKNLRTIFEEVCKMKSRRGASWRTGCSLEAKLSIAAASATTLNPEIGRLIWSSIINHAIINLLDEGTDPNIDNLERHLRNAENEYLRKPKQRLVLMTNLSLDHALIGERKRKGSRIVIEQHPPREYLAQRESKKFRRLLENVPVKDAPVGSVTARVFVDARVEAEGYERASTLLDTLRGIWDLSLTYRSYRIVLGAEQPIARVSRGPVETVHRTGRRLAEAGGVWYYPSTQLRKGQHD